eukprot:Gb_20411 [translate_table: standard]
MSKQPFDSPAIFILALGRTTLRSMYQKIQHLPQLQDPLLPSFFILSIELSHRWMSNHLMRMTHKLIILIASITYVKIRACFTTPSLSCLNIIVAHIACTHESRCCWVMKVIKNHHGRMFGPTQCIILVMVSLTKA